MGRMEPKPAAVVRGRGEKAGLGSSGCGAVERQSRVFISKRRSTWSPAFEWAGWNRSRLLSSAGAARRQDWGRADAARWRGRAGCSSRSAGRRGRQLLNGPDGTEAGCCRPRARREGRIGVERMRRGGEAEQGVHLEAQVDVVASF